jgi:hypothetical protein
LRECGNAGMRECGIAGLRECCRAGMWDCANAGVCENARMREGRGTLVLGDWPRGRSGG